MRRTLAFLLVVACSRGLPASASERAPLTFERDVRPILKAHCFACHGEEGKPKGGLDARLVRSLVHGGDSGEAIVPGDHGASYLWERLEADEMPPGDKKLSAAAKATIAAWIDQGARTVRPEPETLAPGPVLTEEERAFWSFQPVRRPAVPTVRHAELVRNPIDAFLLARLEAKGLSYGPEAPPATLRRRLTFDLTGPPIGSDGPEGRYEDEVERLLASPRYGERWARHWLDVAGYADSDGVSPADPERKYIYKYRDYLIRSFNADRPWDELVREQLAGDELVSRPYEGLAPEDWDRLIATGFLRTAPDGTSGPTDDAEQARNDVMAETIKIVSSSLLGLTVGCAQCHSHRYDPITHEDYHRLRAIFEPALGPKAWRPSSERLISVWTEADRDRAAAVDTELKAIAAERSKEVDALVASVLERELGAAPEELRDALRAARDTPAKERSDEQARLLKEYPRVLVTAGNVSLYDAKAFGAITKRFDAQRSAAQARRPAEDQVHPVTEAPGLEVVTHLFDRGDVHQPRQVVEPGGLSVLGGRPIPVDDPSVPTTGRRLAYARYLTSGQHPLVARVLVNRVWMHHFGQGLVATPADFGALGDRPSHPELLDWLADEFVRSGWSLKHLHRLMVTTTAYRQSSRRRAEHDAVDPENRLLGRMPVRRLDAEMVRDAILSASGRLYGKMYGPPVPVAPDETGQVIVANDNRDSAGRPVGKRVPLGPEEFRRGVYLQARRSLPVSLLEAFDEPVMAPNCDRRVSSTVAPQALMLMNNEFVITQSEAFAARVEGAAGPSVEAQARLAWRLAYGSDPTDEQASGAVAFLDALTSEFASQGKGDDAEAGASPARRAVAMLGQAFFASNAFLYID